MGSGFRVQGLGFRVLGLRENASIIPHDILGYLISTSLFGPDPRETQTPKAAMQRQAVWGFHVN